MIRLDVKELGTSSHGNTAAPELAMDKKELLEALDTAQGIIKYSAFIASGSRQDARRVLTFSLRRKVAKLEEQFGLESFCLLKQAQSLIDAFEKGCGYLREFDCELVERHLKAFLLSRNWSGAHFRHCIRRYFGGEKVSELEHLSAEHISLLEEHCEFHVAVELYIREQFDALLCQDINLLHPDRYYEAVGRPFSSRCQQLGIQRNMEQEAIQGHILGVIRHFFRFLNSGMLTGIRLQPEEKVLTALTDQINGELLSIRHGTRTILERILELIPILRKMDSSCYVLDRCICACKAYLKVRKDAVSIVLDILSFRLRGLGESGIVPLEVVPPAAGNPFALDYEKMADCSDWRPDPIFASEPISARIKEASPLSVLVLLLAEPNALATSFNGLLASELLRARTEDELLAVVDSVALMKEALGSAIISGCADVMVADILDSRQQRLGTDTLQLSVISHRYWPSASGHDTNARRVFEHPETIAAKAAVLASQYTAQMGTRRITPRSSHDEVEIELGFDNGSWTFSCPPEAAIFMESFDFGEEALSFDAKTARILTGLNGDMVRSAVQFWLAKRVLILHKDKSLSFASSYDPGLPDCVDGDVVLLEESGGFADEEAELDAEALALQSFWPLIINMFKTFGHLSAERIHSTLGMFSKEYKGPLPVLVKFLQHKVREGALSVSGSQIILYSTAGMAAAKPAR